MMAARMNTSLRVLKLSPTMTHEDCYAVDREGNPLICFNDSNCVSKLRILRTASTHYPVLRHFLHALLSQAIYMLLL